MIASVQEIERVAMLTIRREQVNVLSSYMLKSFQDRMVKQIATDFPKQYKDLGEPGVCNLVQQGINKAGKHGIERECDVATLIELMLEFSPDFEAQPGRAWAPRILNHPTLSGQAKVESLCLRMKGRTRES